MLTDRLPADHPNAPLQPIADAISNRQTFRFGNATPTPRPAFRLTVVRPGEPEKVVIVLGHVPLAAAMFNAGVFEGRSAVVKIESVSA